MAVAPLAGKTALVTGASRGIGAAIATSLAGAGVRVAVVARSEASLREVAERIGGGAFAVQCDVADPHSVTRAAGVVRDEFVGPPDILVNNAGLFHIKPIAMVTSEEFVATIQTNLVAPFFLLREFLADMYKRGTGDIVTIGSSADRNIFPGNGAYAASKFGARAMHEVLRAETRSTGIRAMLISPAGVDTSLWDTVRFPGSDAPPDRSAMIGALTVADAVLFALMQPREVNIDELRLSHS